MQRPTQGALRQGSRQAATRRLPELSAEARGAHPHLRAMVLRHQQLAARDLARADAADVEAQAQAREQWAAVRIWLAAERVAPLLAAESQRSRPSVVKGLRSVPERSVPARAAQRSPVGEPELLHCLQLLTRQSERSASTQAHSIAA